MIPLPTTTITVERVPVDATRDGYDPAPAPDTIAAGVSAHIGSPSASPDIAGGDRVAYRFTLTCDPVDLREGDTVTDEKTGDQYTVDWARVKPGLGLDHVTARLRIVRGAS